MSELQYTGGEISKAVAERERERRRSLEGTIELVRETLGATATGDGVRIRNEMRTQHGTSEGETDAAVHSLTLTGEVELNPNYRLVRKSS